MPEASDDPRREDPDIGTPTDRSKVDRLRTDPPRPEDAMPEIVMMSDTFDGIDLQSPGHVAALAPQADPTAQDDASAYAITPPANPVTSSIDAPRTERQHAQQVDSTAGASHDWPAQSPTTVLDGIPAPIPVGDPSAKPRRRHRSSRGRRRRWPIVLLVLVLVVGALGAYYAVSFWQVRSTGRTDQARPVDAVVVMGAAQYDGTPSPQLAARLDHVVDLYEQGLAPLVIATGGNQPGDRFTEAEASAAYLSARGVPDSAILLENSGSNTYESLDSVAEMMSARGLDQVLIVTDPYHALRSRLIAEEVGLDAYVSPTPSSVVSGWSSMRRRLAEAAGVAVGRVIGFERLSGLTS
jgi:uncharacterized SAM-binding protein YcdF (DUF218 family)